MNNLHIILASFVSATVFFVAAASAEDRPNIVLFLADDMGYGELGCYGNPDAITPNLDHFASQGLRLTDCHAASSVCSPARSSLLTGRTPFRNGVFTWIPKGSPIHLRTSEQALPKLLKQAGYDTCHVGKWHLNGLRGPGVPILDKDPHGPGNFGFDTWLSVTNFFDINPIMSRNGKFKEFKGDSSEIKNYKIENKSDRTLMLLPEQSDKFLDSAILTTKNNGVIHYYSHIHADEKSNAPKLSEQHFLETTSVKSTILGSKIVRPVGPRFYQTVVDVKIKK